MSHFYGSHVPIPLDLQDRARLGARFISRNLDRRYTYLPTFWTIFEAEQVYGRHDFPDFGDLTSRYLEALYLVKDMSGTSDHDEALCRLEKLFVSYFRHEDGLSYRPPVHQPFMSEVTHKPYEAEVVEAFDQSRVMHALLTWYRITKDGRPRELFNKLVQGLCGNAIFKHDYMYFERPSFTPGYQPDPNAEPYPQQLYFLGTMILPLVDWSQETGNEMALETAGKIVNFF